MQNKIEKLKTFVGEPYRQFDEEGNYIGCFAPLYHIWGDSPRYPLPESESSYFDVAFLCLLENFEVVFASEDCGFYELLPRFDSASEKGIAPVKSKISTSPTSSESAESSSLPPHFTSEKGIAPVKSKISTSPTSSESAENSHFLHISPPQGLFPPVKSEILNGGIVQLAKQGSTPRFGSASASLIPPVKSEILNGGIVQLAKQGSTPRFDSASASLIPLDVVVFRLLYGVLHVGIYLGENRLLHVQRGGTAEIVRFSRLSHRVVAVLRK